MTVRELLAHMLGREVDSLPLPINWDQRRLAMQVRVAVPDREGEDLRPIVRTVRDSRQIVLVVEE
jgi:hypothetical protein